MTILLTVFLSPSLLTSLTWADPPNPPLSRDAMLFWDALMETPPRIHSDLHALLLMGVQSQSFAPLLNGHHTGLREFLNHPQVRARIVQGVQVREQARLNLLPRVQRRLNDISRELGVDLNYRAWVQSQIEAFQRANQGPRNYTTQEAEREARHRLQTMLGREPNLSPGSPDLTHYQRLVSRIEFEENPLSRRTPERARLLELATRLRSEAGRRRTEFASANIRLFLSARPNHRLYLMLQSNRTGPTGYLEVSEVAPEVLRQLISVRLDQLANYQIMARGNDLRLVDDRGNQFLIYTNLDQGTYERVDVDSSRDLVKSHLAETRERLEAAEPEAIPEFRVFQQILRDIDNATEMSLNACRDINCLRRKLAGTNTLSEALVETRLNPFVLQAEDSPELRDLRTLMLARSLTEPISAMNPSSQGDYRYFSFRYGTRTEPSGLVASWFRSRFGLGVEVRTQESAVRSSALSNEIGNHPREGLNRIRLYRVRNSSLFSPDFFEVAEPHEEGHPLGLAAPRGLIQRTLGRVRGRRPGTISIEPTNLVTAVGERILIPTPDRHELTAFELQNELGQLLELGRDFRILKSVRSDAVMIELLSSDRGRASGSFRYTAVFQRARDLRPDSAAPDIPLSRLSRVIDDLSQEGFHELARVLSGHLTHALRTGRRITLTDLERAVEQTSLYSDFPTEVLSEEAGRPRYRRYRNFLDQNARTCVQCNGANAILRDLFNDLDPAGRNLARVRGGFSYSGGRYLTAANAHAQAVYQAGKARGVVYDSTPRAHDRRDARAAREAMRAQSPPEVPPELRIARATTAVLENRQALIDALKLNRYLPRDPAEPARRALRLAELMMLLARGEGDLTEINATLEELRFSNRSEDMSRAPQAIAEAATEVTNRLETIRGATMGRQATYGAGQIRERTLNLLTSIAALSQIPIPFETCVANVLETGL